MVPSPKTPRTFSTVERPSSLITLPPKRTYLDRGRRSELLADGVTNQENNRNFTPTSQTEETKQAFYVMRSFDNNESIDDSFEDMSQKTNRHDAKTSAFETPEGKTIENSQKYSFFHTMAGEQNTFDKYCDDDASYIRTPQCSEYDCLMSNETKENDRETNICHHEHTRTLKSASEETNIQILDNYDVCKAPLLPTSPEFSYENFKIQNPRPYFTPPRGMERSFSLHLMSKQQETLKALEKVATEDTIDLVAGLNNNSLNTPDDSIGSMYRVNLGSSIPSFFTLDSKSNVKEQRETYYMSPYSDQPSYEMKRNNNPPRLKIDSPSPITSTCVVDSIMK